MPVQRRFSSNWTGYFGGTSGIGHAEGTTT